MTLYRGIFFLQHQEVIMNTPQWNLKDLYNSVKDKAIEEDLAKAEKDADKLVQSYMDKIKDLSGAELGLAISQYEKISEVLGKVGAYAYLSFAQNMADSKVASFYQNISEKLNDISSKTIFLTLEVAKISDSELTKQLSAKALQKYQPFIRDVRVSRKYQKSRQIEEILLNKGISSNHAWSRLFDETMADLEFTMDKKKYSSSEIFNFFSSTKPEIRKKAAKAVGKTFADNIKIFAYITNILAKDKAINDKIRGFKSPVSERNIDNLVEDEVVEALINTVKKNYKKTAHKYFTIKAKVFGVKQLNYWDRNAPFPKVAERKIPWEEAKEIVLSAYSNFSPAMAKIGEEFFSKNWIDAKMRKGKDSGAFAHPVTPSTHPYILLNYQGKTRDVMTLAHELGHGIHQILAAKQGYLMADTPLTLAETASIFGEQLVFEELLRREKNKDKKNLLIAGKVEDMLNTIVRQVAFFEFEKGVHEARKGGELAVEEINKIWLKTQQESLGAVIKFDDEYKYYWSYIPHFIHSPFYVYAYAFGNCLVNSLYMAYKAQPQGFEAKYIQMLSAGGTLHHKELLAPFGLDASQANFWQQGIDMMSDYIDQLQRSIAED
jgi:oligoendopeptidase F